MRHQCTATCLEQQSAEKQSSDRKTNADRSDTERLDTERHLARSRSLVGVGSDATSRLAGLWRSSVWLLVLSLCGVAAVPAYANDSDLVYTGFAEVRRSIHSLPVNKNYALGINRHDVDAHTEILGWQLRDNWYFGRQDGLDSGLTLVWQQEGQQFSLSKDGLRLTRWF